jgi:selenocysteine lyase/cysteine desulfurase
MSFVANGLDVGAGDEVLTTDHEHIGGLEPWKLVTARRGAKLVVARLPVPAASSEELLEAIWSRVGPATRVVSVSHVTFTNGTTLPVAALAARCAERGIPLAVDGAHPPGMMSVDVNAIGCDFYASSPHKWLLAPPGTGLLYLAPRWRRTLWPTLASGGWDDLDLGAHRFNHLGTFDESRLAGLLAAAEFLQAIGMERVEARTRALRARVQEGLASIPGVAVTTPSDEALRSAMVSFTMEGVDGLDLQAWLAREARVRTRVVSEYGLGWMRLSTHVYNRPAELDLVLDLLHAAARRGVPHRGA